MRVFLDTSALVAGLIDLGAASEPARTVLQAIADAKVEDAGTAWHCCLEFYSVSTRLPEEYRLTPWEAKMLLEADILAFLTIHDLPGSARAGFLAEAAGEGVRGGRVYDAHIADIARLAGAQIVVTDNPRHFTSLLKHGIQVLTVEQFASTI